MIGAALETAAWIVGACIVLSVLGLIADRCVGRPRWTPDCYRPDEVPVREKESVDA